MPLIYFAQEKTREMNFRVQTYMIFLQHNGQLMFAFYEKHFFVFGFLGAKLKDITVCM